MLIPNAASRVEMKYSTLRGESILVIPGRMAGPMMRIICGQRASIFSCAGVSCRNAGSGNNVSSSRAMAAESIMCLSEAVGLE